MVVDSSALLAILLDEAERDPFNNAILRASTAALSVVSLVESTIALANRRGNAEISRLDELLTELRIDVVPVDLEQGTVARNAFLRFGRGRHPAGLNFGDCFAYALAKRLDEPLLFKGNDFHKTDIVPAWNP